MSTLQYSGATVEFGPPRRRMRAVDRVDLTVPHGTTVGLVGESGSGKSTLAKAAVGLVPLTAGRVLVGGGDVTPRHGRAPRSVQMVFQDPYSSLDPRMTVGDSLAEALPPGTARGARAAEVQRMLSLVQVGADRAELLPGALSGGQRQRVALARALAARPEVVVADEMTSALDVSIQGAMLNLIRELRVQLGLTMLFISHDLSVVRYVSDVIAVMYLGNVVEVAPADELLAAPQHPYTRMLLEAAPRLGVPLEQDTPEARLVRQEPADPHHRPPGCAFHPRCPVGPLARPDRDICRTLAPSGDAHDRRHEAACHFVPILEARNA